MNNSLFEGPRVRLAAPDPEHDADIESRWTHDSEYLRQLEMSPARPLSPGQVKKRREAAIKAQDAFHFAIRTRADDRLIGFAAFERITWTHGTAHLSIGIGDAQDRGQGYGQEALALVLRYAFAELNLYRLTASTAERNERAVRLLERAGFQLEVRRRQAIHRDGRRWDLLMFGLLREEWERNMGKSGEGA